jgi:hypothetical protein
MMISKPPLVTAEMMNCIIHEESKVLKAIIRLINDETPFSEWNCSYQVAFLAAFFIDGLPFIEDKKADDGRYLMGLQGAQNRYTMPNTRLAERIRADLPRCIRFRGGKYLIGELSNFSRQ